MHVREPETGAFADLSERDHVLKKLGKWKDGFGVNIANALIFEFIVLIRIK
jgi:hypothetical protein